MLMIIPEGERNTVDQEAVVATLLREFKVRTLRRKFKEVLNSYKLDQDSGKLFVDGKEIALVYFRAGYQEEHYTDAETSFWDLKFDIEQSTAVKLPSIDTQLLTLKKF